MFTELAPGVYSVATRFVDGTNGIIVGKRGALAVDVGYYPDEGSATADFIRALGRLPNRVVLTHGHSDHVLGGAAFAGADVFASAKTPPEMRRQLRNFAARKQLSEDELLAQALWPTVTFTGELFIDLGGKPVHLFHAPGHSFDHIAVYLPEDQVLFAGDNVVTAILPAVGDGDSRELEATLHQLMALNAEILVAGHGQPLIGASNVREWITWTILYLRTVRAAMGEALRVGMTPAQAADTATLERFVGDRLPADKHNMPRRNRDTALKIATEEATPQPESAQGK
jgi:glyoxylase-like metal-dependent hydrolase (beta-lactamase superfamily II)